MRYEIWIGKVFWKNGMESGSIVMTRLPVMIVVDDPQQTTELSALVKKNGYTVAAIVSGGEDPVKHASAEKSALSWTW